MKNFMRILIALAIGIGTTACSIPHHIAEDYPKYLNNNRGQANLPQTRKASEYALTPTTQNFRYEFRAVTTGYANLWIVDIGKMLDDTLKSDDVQRAFGKLQKNTSQAQPSNNLLLFNLDRYTFEDYGAHVAMKVELFRSGNTIFSKSYSVDGKTQGGKMFWGGVFAQKNAVQQSTKLAIDEILRQLINDLNVLPE